MKDPGPNLLEQQIETNRLLALILAGAAGDGGLATLAGGAVPIQWPILFYFSNPSNNPFTITGSSGGCTGAVSFLDRNSINAGGGLKMTAPTGSGQWTRAEVDIPEPPSRQLRVQAALANGPGPAEASWNIALTYYDRTNLHRGTIHLLNSNAEAFYVKSDGLEGSLGQFAWAHQDYAWNKIDLSVDFGADKYHSGIVNRHGLDLSAQGLQAITDSTWPRIRLRLELHNNSSDHPIYGYVDQVLVTPELYDMPELPE